MHTCVHTHTTVCYAENRGVKMCCSYCLPSGEPTAVQLVLDRFYRLNNGMWIRTKAGRARRRWKKPNRRNWRALEHVTCNRTQCQTLDKMINE